MRYRKKTGIILGTLLFVLILLFILYRHRYPTYYKYNDSWIVGRTIDKVEERYGEFDKEYPGKCGYYIGKDTGFLGIMPSNNDMYYWIEFNEDGTVTKVYVSGPVGG